MKKLLVLLFPIVLFGCKNEDTPIKSTAYGITIIDNVYNMAGDSLAFVDFSTKKQTSVAPINKFNGLGASYPSAAHSINKNIYIYKDPNNPLTIRFINLSSLEEDYLTLQDTTVYVLALHVDEIDNMVYVIVKSRDKQAMKSWLGIIPISLETKDVFPTTNFVLTPEHFSYHYFLSEIDYKHKQFFLKPSNEPELIIYNYNTKEIENKQINAKLFDLHYNSTCNCLLGTGDYTKGFGLFEYSIANNETKQVGEFSNFEFILKDGFYYDKANNWYWIVNYLHGKKLLKIDLSNATIKDSITLNKNMRFAN